jgi:hypothetical protein
MSSVEFFCFQFLKIGSGGTPYHLPRKRGWRLRVSFASAIYVRNPERGPNSWGYFGLWAPPVLAC